MRGFAQTLFNALLGWIRMLVEAVWSLLFSDGTKVWLTWIGNNWLVLVVLLCLIGVAIDYLVWFVRWRPYYVWGSKMRRFGRIFGIGRKERPPAPVRTGRSYAPLPAPLTVEDFEPEQAYPEPVQAYPGPAWEDAVWEEQDASLPETIHARPRKADYQEQYIRRFARPVADPVPQEQEYTQPYGADAPNWEDGPEAYLADAVAEPEPEPTQEEYPPEYELENSQDSYSANSFQNEADPFWDDGTLPQTPPAQEEEPIHPGIDYQELSRKYGWHVPVQQASGQADQALVDGQEEQEQAWDSEGLTNFAPYRPPAAPSAAEPRPRNERARKSKQERTPVEKVRNSLLGRAVKRAGKVLTVDDEESGKMLDGLPPPIDKRRAFHAPVYPQKGQGPAPKDSKSPDFREDD